MNDYSNFTNGNSIKRIVHSLFEPWMSDDEKKDLEQEILQSVGPGMDEAITQGIKNGYSVGDQEKIVSKIFGLS